MMKPRPHMTRAVPLAVTLAAICICQASMADDAWMLAKDEDGIQVYTRSVADSPLREFRGEVELSTSIERVVEVFKDADSYRKWMPDVVDSKILTSSEEEQYQYLENAAPWPVSNRDGVYHVTFARGEEAGAATTIVHVQAVPDYLPRRHGKVRVPRSEGSWKVGSLGR